MEHSRIVESAEPYPNHRTHHVLIAEPEFAKPDERGICRNGLYRISRNPMYVAYFISFLGCVFLTGPVVWHLLLFVFALSLQWIILSEERWCTQKFGAEYVEYMKKVRRYISAQFV